MTITHVTLPSSAIHAVTYDDRAMTLVCHMVHGEDVKYAGVPVRVFQELQKAPSAGKYYNSNIRDNYAFSNE